MCPEERREHLSVFSSVQGPGLEGDQQELLFTSDAELQGGPGQEDEAGEMAPSGKCLPCNYEHSSLIPRTQKKLGMVVCICNLSAVEAETGISRADWTASLKHWRVSGQ